MNQTSHASGIVTVQQHILENQKHHPSASGEFSWLLSGITLATKIIYDHIRKAGIYDVLGETGKTNVQGERVQKLDELANRTILKCLGYRGNIGIMVSEEDDKPHIVQESGEDGHYIVLFDPLDGSSNIDVDISVGTIFSILRHRAGTDRSDTMSHILQPGVKQVAAGYVIYGSSTVLVYTTGNGVHMFTLDPAIGAYVLTRENLRMPRDGRTYSINEAYHDTFPAGIRNYLAWVKSPASGGYSLRYVGSLVADFHRTLLRGGVYLYPPSHHTPDGKLRLLYESNPIAFLAEQAGGMATDGFQRILDKKPDAMHTRTPLIVGSQNEVKRVHDFLHPA